MFGGMRIWGNLILQKRREIGHEPHEDARRYDGSVTT
jgi:hypothetical protein